jgi:hypothetical protein
MKRKQRHLVALILHNIGNKVTNTSTKREQNKHINSATNTLHKPETKQQQSNSNSYHINKIKMMVRIRRNKD